MVSRRLFTFLVMGAIVLPMALAVSLAVARLLGEMGDKDGSAVLNRIALAGGLLWAVDLIALVTTLGLDKLVPPGRPPGPPPE